MICSCGHLTTATQYARTGEDGIREVRTAERCSKCGRIHWLTFWRKAYGEGLPEGRKWGSYVFGND
jgi:hypothetical protein